MFASIGRHTDFFCSYPRRLKICEECLVAKLENRNLKQRIIRTKQRNRKLKQRIILSEQMKRKT